MTTMSPMLPALPKPIADQDAERSAMEACVHWIVGLLDGAGIPYCLLRNRDRIPDGLLGWTDLDLMISDTVSFREVLKLFTGLEPTSIVPVRRGFVTMYLPVRDLLLRVDIFNGDIEWRAAVYGRNQQILAGRRDDDGIMGASPVHQAIIVWFEKLARSSTFVRRYEPLITGAYHTDPAGFRRQLVEVVGVSLADQLIGLIEREALPECIALAPACRRALWMNALRRHPARTFVRYIQQIGDAVNHRLHPPGLNVAIIGADDVGTSSVCATIANLPSRRIPFGRATYARPDHHVLPGLGPVQTSTLHVPNGVARDPAKRRATPLLPPLLWLGRCCYETIDLWLGELLWTRRRIAHMELVIHDRHPLEMVTVPLRYQYQWQMILARALAWLSPKPELVIVFDTPAEVIRSGKPGLTLEEAARQRDAYGSLALQLPNSRMVDASQPLEAVIESAFQTITAYTKERTRKRFGSLLVQEARP